MKVIRRLLCVILSIATLLCCFVTASAAEPIAANVGVLTIFSYKGEGTSSWGSTISGHAFIAFKNVSSSSITIGGLNVGSGHEITLGTWGSQPAGYTISPNQSWHKGIWYNLESYLINKHNDMRPRVSLSMNVTMDDVAEINKIIKNNDTWALLNNCSTFATKVWNSVAPDSQKLSAGSPNMPVSLCVDIQSKSGWQINRAVMDITPIGFVNSKGNFESVTFSVSSNNELSYITNINEYVPITSEVA